MADNDPHGATQSFPGDPVESTADASPASPDVDSSDHPQRIGRYRIEKVLGKGGFGLFYLAHDDQLDRRVAVKVPHARLISKPEDAEAYLTEARTASSDQTLKVWDLQSGKEIRTLQGHSSLVLGVAVTPDGSQAGEPVDRPVRFGELFATLYHNLGIDVETATVTDLHGRPQYLVSDGAKPIHELV